MTAPKYNRLGALVDPEPVVMPIAYGLTALLYRRLPPEPVKPGKAFWEFTEPPPWEQPELPPEPVIDQDAVEKALKHLTPSQRKALGIPLPDDAA